VSDLKWIDPSIKGDDADLPLVIKDRVDVDPSGVYDFFESAYVTRHTEDLDRLQALFDVRLNQGQVESMYSDLCSGFGLSFPKMKWTARTDRGLYDSIDRSIRLRPEYISAGIAVHELAHHWVEVKLGWGNVPNHGWDFTMRLDKLAESAWGELRI